MKYQFNNRKRNNVDTFSKLTKIWSNLKQKMKNFKITLEKVKKNFLKFKINVESQKNKIKPQVAATNNV